MNDPAFQADMKKRKLEVTPSTAAEIQQTVGANLKISKAVVDKTRKILFGGGS